LDGRNRHLAGFKRKLNLGARSDVRPSSAALFGDPRQLFPIRLRRSEVAA
jgi:hypothetical protein